MTNMKTKKMSNIKLSGVNIFVYLIYQIFQNASLKIVFTYSIEIFFAKLRSACLNYNLPNKHIEHMHEGVWLKKKNFRQNYSYEN